MTRKLLLACTLVLAACGNEVVLETSSSASGDSTTTTASSGVGGEGGGIPTEKKLEIELSDETPSSTNVIAGQDAWHPYSAYTVTNITDTAQTLNAADIAQVDPNGDAADFTEVALAKGGVVCLAGTTMHLVGSQEHFALTPIANSPCDPMIPPQSAVTIEVWGKTAPVVPSVDMNDAWHGLPRSGHSDILRVDLLGVTSDPVGTWQGPSTGNDPKQMVVRKSVPAITQVVPTVTDFTGSKQELLKFQISADSAGPIGVIEFTPRFKKSGAFDVPDLTFQHNGIDLPPGSYSITVVGEDEATYDAMMPSELQSGGTIIIRFADAQVITGSGGAYALVGTANNLAAGDMLKIEFKHTIKQYNDFRVPTGFLTDMGKSIPLQVTTKNAGFGGTVTWKDLSTVDSLIKQGASVDWTDDLYLHTLNWDQVFTY